MERDDIPDTIRQGFGHTGNQEGAAWRPGDRAATLSRGTGQETQNDLFVPPESYVKFLNVEVLKMSSHRPSPTGSQAPLRKGKLQRVQGEEHLTLESWALRALLPPFTSAKDNTVLPKSISVIRTQA